MKKITLIVAFMLLAVFGFSQTTVTVGTGTAASGTNDNGNPVYRSTATSSFSFSQSVQLLKPSDLSAVGVTAGASITKIAYFKTTAFTMGAGRTADLKIYLKNSGSTSLVTNQTMATWTTGATLGYSNPAISSTEIPAAAGWVEFTLSTPFNYTGAAIEVAIDWAGTGAGSGLTTGAFQWQYTTGTAGQAVGISSSSVITGDLTTQQTRLYNTQLIFTNNPCSGTPSPGNTIASSLSPCLGANVTFSLQNPTIGSGVTYQWYNNAGIIAAATNPTYTAAINSADSYYCDVTCSGVTTASSTLAITPSSAISTFPWIENFESLTTLGATNFPSCWVKENGDWASSNETTYNTALSGNNYIRDSWTATNEFIWTQGFQLTAGTSYDFSTFIQGDGYAGWVVDYFYNSAANSTGAAQLGASYNVPGSGTASIQQYNKVTKSFVPTTTGIYFFGVRVNQPSFSPWYVALDDFEVKLTPATVPLCASNFVSTPDTSCGNDPTVITWTAAANANGYFLTVGTTSGASDVLNSSDIGGVTTYNFVGALATTYYYTITPYNGSGTASGCSENTFTTVATGCYCPSTPTSNDGAGITNVQLGTSDFPNGDVFYFDHTAIPVTLSQGINTNVQVSFATGFTYDTYLWIDLNDNFVFESSEILFSGVSSATNPTTLNASFLMPANAPFGNHRMRIVTADDLLTPNACYSGSYGVTLEFTVNIVAASCTPPAATASIVPDCANNNYSINVNVTALGNGTPTISDGTTSWPVNTIGTVNIGPFANGSSNTLTLLHGGDATCDLPLGTFTYSCPPANDECSGAIQLTVNSDLNCGVSTSGTVNAATASNVDATACFGTENDDVWFSFVASNASHRIQLTNVSNFTDMFHSLWTGNCSALTLVPNSCSDSDTSNPTSLVVGQTYYIRVNTYGATANTATFDVCVGTPPPPPANDECSNATVLPFNGTTCDGTNNNGTNDSATDSGVANAVCFFYGQNDVWFSVLVPVGVATIDVSTDFTGGTLVDTEIALYSGACGSLTEVACDQDGGTTTLSNGFSFNSLITNAAVTGGNTYYVRVSGYSASDTGTFCLKASTNTLGNSNFDNASFSFYPNPVKDFLNLDYSETITNVSVFNLLGQQVLALSLNTTSGRIDFSNLASGAYLVKVSSQAGEKMIKVIKE